MLAHVNNVQPKAELPLVRTQKHSNAMPQRTPKTTQRNLTGLYLGVEGGNQQPFRQNTLPMKSRGRGMPSRRIRTPTEERRYKKVEMLRSGGDRRGFSGNPVKHFQARGLVSTDEMTRASMYPADSDQFWDVTRQTTRQFTAPPNSGIKHLEYLYPDPDDIISTYYPRAFDKSLDEVLVQEIQKAVNLKKEVAGLVHCYNKICKGNTRALQSLLPNRGLNPNRTSVCLKTGFSIKSYQSPRQAEIVADFPKVQPRPKTVVGVLGERPLVPSPYFFKQYNTPKTAGYRPSATEQDSQIVASPGAGCLSRTLNKLQQPAGAESASENPAALKTTTLHAEELIPVAPAATPVQPGSRSLNNNSTEKVNVTLPVAGKSSPQIDQLSLDAETAKDTENNSPGDPLPSETNTDDKTTHHDKSKETEEITASAEDKANELNAAGIKPHEGDDADGKPPEGDEGDADGKPPEGDDTGGNNEISEKPAGTEATEDDVTTNIVLRETEGDAPSNNNEELEQKTEAADNGEP